jgi:nucleotide-binding universal stress UspA family protein
MRSGQVIVGFDGTPASVRAVHEAAALFAGRRALVVVVWEAGRAFDLTVLASRGLELPPGNLDIRTAIELDRAMYQEARQLARWGAQLATEDGLEADCLAVADDLTVADTLVRLAKEHNAPVVVVGAHRHSRLTELLLGTTTKGVIERAPSPVLVVRAD